MATKNPKVEIFKALKRLSKTTITSIGLEGRLLVNGIPEESETTQFLAQALRPRLKAIIQAELEVLRSEAATQIDTQIADKQAEIAALEALKGGLDA